MSEQKTKVIFMLVNIIGWYHKVLAILIVVTLWRMQMTSDVGLKLFNYPDTVVHGVLLMYCSVLLIAVFARPEDFRKAVVVHGIAGVFAGVVFLGRGWSFLELLLSDRPDLEGAVWERVAMFGFALYYHITVPLVAFTVSKVQSVD